MDYAIGLMSGTSLDGVDVVLVKISGHSEETVIQQVDFITVKIPKKTLINIKKCLSLESSNSKLLCSLNFELGELFGNAAVQICKKNKIDSSTIKFIASHGQTIYHQPNKEDDIVVSTLQLGESSVIAEITQTSVISDFRYRDMAVMGQGAPIVPYSEFILYRDPNKTRIMQNIGGIGNATILPKNCSINEIVAFDTGPGNMIIDELCRIFYQKEYDKDGLYASRGKVSEELLDYLMSHPYIEKPIPKTTGREEFGVEFTQKIVNEFELNADDFIATATMFTAKSIAKTVIPFTSSNTELIIAGGGSYNDTLVSYIKQQLPTVNVLIQEDLGYSSEAKEAIAMVILGNQTYNKKKSNVPSATGATKQVILGKITY